MPDAIEVIDPGVDGLETGCVDAVGGCCLSTAIDALVGIESGANNVKAGWIDACCCCCLKVVIGATV